MEVELTMSLLSVAQHFAAGKLANKLILGPPENELVSLESFPE